MEEKGESFLFALSLSSQQSFVYLKKKQLPSKVLPHLYAFISYVKSFWGFSIYL